MQHLYGYLICFHCDTYGHLIEYVGGKYIKVICPKCEGLGYVKEDNEYEICSDK